MSHVSKSKISFSIFKPKTVAFDAYKDSPYKVGIIAGRATGLSQRTDDRTGEVYTGLKGSFRAFLGNDASPKSEDTVSSGIIYLPDAWLHPIVDAFEAAKAADDIAPSVDFVYEVCLGRRGEQDYEWVVRDLRPAGRVDPLASVIESATAAGALEDKSGETPVKEKAAKA